MHYADYSFEIEYMHALNNNNAEAKIEARLLDSWLLSLLFTVIFLTNIIFFSLLVSQCDREKLIRIFFYDNFTFFNKIHDEVAIKLSTTFILYNIIVYKCMRCTKSWIENHAYEKKLASAKFILYKVTAQ